MRGGRLATCAICASRAARRGPLPQTMDAIGTGMVRTIRHPIAENWKTEDRGLYLWTTA